jgi:two-component system sensor histidine kinase DesK
MGGITALGALFMPINPGASCFFIYAASFAGEAGPPRVAVRYIAAIVAVVLLEGWFFQTPLGALMPGVVFSILIGGVNVHFGEMRRKEDKLRLAQEEVEHLAKVAERERIARDLHDLLGHTLSVIVLKSELASKLAERNPRRAVEEIREVEQISRQALAEVRRAVEGYRSATLVEEVANARRALQAADIALEEQIEEVTLAPPQESALAFALREAVTNVVRHARARTCRIRLSLDRGRVALEVTDDGVGGDRPEGAGLTGMRARVGEAGGYMERDGGTGTRVRVVLPVDRPACAPPALAS